MSPSTATRGCNPNVPTSRGDARPCPSSPEQPPSCAGCLTMAGLLAPLSLPPPSLPPPSTSPGNVAFIEPYKESTAHAWHLISVRPPRSPQASSSSPCSASTRYFSYRSNPRETSAEGCSRSTPQPDVDSHQADGIPIIRLLTTGEKVAERTPFPSSGS